jgi:hypothetical protein
MTSLDARTIDDPTYRVQVTRAGVRRDYVRPVKETTVLDAMASLPQELMPKLMNARIDIIRGAKILEVDWRRIVLNGEAATNYQLCVGDLIVVELRGTGP